MTFFTPSLPPGSYTIAFFWVSYLGSAVSTLSSTGFRWEEITKEGIFYCIIQPWYFSFFFKKKLWKHKFSRRGFRLCVLENQSVGVSVPNIFSWLIAENVILWLGGFLCISHLKSLSFSTHGGGCLGTCIVLACNLSLMQLHIYNIIAMLSYLTGGCMARYTKSLWDSEGTKVCKPHWVE